MGQLARLADSIGSLLQLYEDGLAEAVGGDFRELTFLDFAMHTEQLLANTLAFILL